MIFQYSSHTKACKILFHICYTKGRLTIDLNLINKSRNRTFSPSFFSCYLKNYNQLPTSYIFQLKSANQVVFISNKEINYKMIVHSYLIQFSFIDERTEVSYSVLHCHHSSSIARVTGAQSPSIPRDPFTTQMLSLFLIITFLGLALGLDCFWS